MRTNYTGYENWASVHRKSTPSLRTVHVNWSLLEQGARIDCNPSIGVRPSACETVNRWLAQSYAAHLVQSQFSHLACCEIKISPACARIDRIARKPHMGNWYQLAQTANWVHTAHAVRFDFSSLPLPFPSILPSSLSPSSVLPSPSPFSSSYNTYFTYSFAIRATGSGHSHWRENVQVIENLLKRKRLCLGFPPFLSSIVLILSLWQE